ncbi:MAG: glycosyl hydrolase family 18 protein, partial [Longimicrobiales bacterium]|nr:glycosyl hydrolase family 18 protein [Longimicrobiales bacterium]
HGWPERWSDAMAAARAAGVQVVPTVSMHDADAFEALFADAGAVARLVDTLLGILATDAELAGLHLDVEVFRPVDPAARDGYTAFVARLAKAMRETHPTRTLSVFVLAFDDDDVYNERALGQIADFVVVQGYDYHSMGSSNAGPVGAVRGWGRLSWENVLARFDGFGVPRERMVMSVPLYGYEWPVVSEEAGAAASGTAVTVPYAAPADILPDAPRARQQGEAHGVRRDPESGSPYYVYRDGDGWRQGWYEDAESLRLKFAFVRENGLGGIALFPLAYGTEELWDELRRAFAPR